jgi:transcription-repair coupling factor (superfamily II helicase)
MLDRFGPLPHEAENLLSLQKARVALASAGADAVQFRGGLLTVTGVELDSAAADALRGAAEGARYDWKSQEVSARMENDPEIRLEGIVALADSLAGVRMDMLSNS